MNTWQNSILIVKQRGLDKGGVGVILKGLAEALNETETNMHTKIIYMKISSEFIWKSHQISRSLGNQSSGMKWEWANSFKLNRSINRSIGRSVGRRRTVESWVESWQFRRFKQCLQCWTLLCSSGTYLQFFNFQSIRDMSFDLCWLILVSY